MTTLFKTFLDQYPKIFLVLSLKIIILSYIIFSLSTAYVFYFQPESISPTVAGIFFNNLPHWFWGTPWFIGAIFGLIFLKFQNIVFFVAANFFYVSGPLSIALAIAYGKYFQGTQVSVIGYSIWFLIAINAIATTIKNWPLQVRS